MDGFRLHQCPFRITRVCEIALSCINECAKPGDVSYKIAHANKVCEYCCATQDNCKKCNYNSSSEFVGRELIDLKQE